MASTKGAGRQTAASADGNASTEGATGAQGAGTTVQTPHRTLWRRILAVQSEVGAVPKNGRNEHFKYDYVKEEDLVLAVRRLLVKHELALTWSQVSCRQVEGLKNITELVVDFYLTNPDDPTEREVERVYAYGQDSADKGPYKAMTGAQKYFLMKTFLVPTGDDPERDEQVHTQAQRSQGRRAAPPPEEPAEPEEPEDPLLGPATLQTVAAVRELMKHPAVPANRRKDAETYMKKQRREIEVRKVVEALVKYLDPDEAEVYEEFLPPIEEEEE